MSDTVSPLAPQSFPQLPPLAGVALGTLVGRLPVLVVAEVRALRVVSIDDEVALFGEEYNRAEEHASEHVEEA